MLQIKSYIVVIGALLVAPLARAQSPEVSYQQKHTTVQLQEMLHTDIPAKGHDGVSHNFSCVPMKAVLAPVQPPSGENLLGAGMTLAAIASAKDNYHAVFSLAQQDESVGDKQTFVCNKQDGKPLSTADGPLRLVVPSDKRPARWVRMLTSQDIQRALSQ